jgi:hypothetical protein
MIWLKSPPTSRAIARDDRLAECDVRRPLLRLILSRGKGDEHKACGQGEQTTEAIHSNPNLSGGKPCKSI